VLFEAWWALITSQTPPSSIPPQCPSLPALAKDNTINFYSRHPQFRVGWDPLKPLDTPAGLANAAAIVPYLICAAELVQAAYGALFARGGLLTPDSAIVPCSGALRLVSLRFAAAAGPRARQNRRPHVA
jgi:hypothetical protein